MKVRVFRITWPADKFNNAEWMAGPTMIPAEVAACYDMDGAAVTEFEGELTVGDEVEK